MYLISVALPFFLEKMEDKSTNDIIISFDNEFSKINLIFANNIYLFSLGLPFSLIFSKDGSQKYQMIYRSQSIK